MFINHYTINESWGKELLRKTWYVARGKFLRYTTLMHPYNNKTGNNTWSMNECDFHANILLTSKIHFGYWMLRKIYVFDYFLLFLIFKNVFLMDTILTSFYSSKHWKILWKFRFEWQSFVQNFLLIKRLIR